MVTGATGNVGTSTVAALARDPNVHEVVALARRRPAEPLAGAEHVAADVTESDLGPIFRGADAVIHLAWLIQPGRDRELTHRVNVEGSRRVFAAAVAAGVPSLVHASSVGAYAPGPKDRTVDEGWPTSGVPSSFYSRDKVAVERELDRIERSHPDLRVVRLRPGLIFKREAATEIRRLFVGPLLPPGLMSSRWVPVAPAIPGLRFQAVHTDDVADAYRRAVLGTTSGAFNIAAEPPIGAPEIARLLNARSIRIPAPLVRGLAAATFALRLQPTEPGWLDMALAVPMLDTTRARRELGWSPRHDALSTLSELFDGLRANADGSTPPLTQATSGPGRIREFLTGLGARQ